METYHKKEGDEEIFNEILQQDEIVLIRRKGDFCDYQVWSNDYELMYGTFNPKNIPDIAHRIKMAYEFGMMHGEKIGESKVKSDLRKILDVPQNSKEQPYD